MANRQCVQGDACHGKRGDLEAHRELVRQLYVDEDLNLQDLMDLMSKDHGVTASTNMYKKKLRRWNVRKRDASQWFYAVPKEEPAKSLFRFHRKEAPVTLARSSTQGSQGSHASNISSYSSPTSTSVSHPRSSNTPEWVGLDQAWPDSPGTSSDIPQTLTYRYSGYEVDGANESRKRAIMQTPPLQWVEETTTNKRVRRGTDTGNTQLELVTKPAIQRLSPPTNLLASEALFYAIRTHTIRLVQPRLNVPGVFGSGTSALDTAFRVPLHATPSMAEFAGAISNGVGILATNERKRAIASLNQGLCLVKPMLKDDSWATFSCIVWTVMATKMRNAPEVGEIVLKQIARMANVIYGPDHPYCVFARVLLLHSVSDGLMEAALTSYSDAVEGVLGPDDHENITARMYEFELGAKIRRNQYRHDDISGILAKYKSLLGRFQNNPRSQWDTASLSLSYAEILFETGDFKEVESVLKRVPLLLTTFETNGWKADGTAPVSMTIIIRCMSLLGGALNAQGKDQQARDVFRRATAASSKYLGSNDPATIEVIGRFGNVLASQSLDDEARAIYAALDERLSKYMLRRELADAPQQDLAEDDWDLDSVSLPGSTVRTISTSSNGTPA